MLSKLELEQSGTKNTHSIKSNTSLYAQNPIIHNTKALLYKRALSFKIAVKNYLFKASLTATATATVAPTIGLLPIPMIPIIST